jgi:hypothetical protein
VEDLSYPRSSNGNIARGGVGERHLVHDDAQHNTQAAEITAEPLRKMYPV